MLRDVLGAFGGRRHARHRAPSTGPSLGSTLVATTAAVGAVATGTFTAVAPTAGGTPTANAAEGGGHANKRANFSQGFGDVFSTLGIGESGRRVAGFVPVAHATEPADQVSDHVAAVEKAGRVAAEIAELHRQEAERARIAELIKRGGLDGWIAEALQILELPQSLAPSVKKIIMAESSGNPQAINLWDSNAAQGTPSQGLMQTIPSTFRAYVHPTVADRPITDPVANITAGVRYMISRYGMDTLQRGGRSDGYGNYIGY